MKHFTLITLFFLIAVPSAIQAQEDENYLEFNDRKNIVHGVYLGITTHYGEIDGKETYLGGFKIAYVANQQFEVGWAGVGFYSQQDLNGGLFSGDRDLAGGYGGLHLEPIFFSKSRINLSIPLLIGVGGVAYVDRGGIFDDDFDIDFDGNPDRADAFFIAEPGLNLLFNVSRYLQIEAGVRYRLASKLDLNPDVVSSISGFSGGVGIKVGVFNLGRNRYKKDLSSGE